MKREPEQIINKAIDEHNIVARFCMFSGGDDSAITAHRMSDYYHTLVYIDTGTAVPGVREFVVSFSEYLGKELKIYETPRDEYRRMVLGSDKIRENGKPDKGLGFPGPAQHTTCYNRLKQYQIEQLVRENKKFYSKERVLLITGVRRAESQKRKNVAEIKRKDSIIWCNPLIDWTNEDMHKYREKHNVPRSDVAALLHRSGECNCGAYAIAGEREELQAIFPEWFEKNIRQIEIEAEKIGLRSVWGAGRITNYVKETDQMLCSSCEYGEGV